MGVGPVVVIPTTMKATGLEIDDIDLFEINEVKYGVYCLFMNQFYLLRIASS